MDDWTKCPPSVWKKIPPPQIGFLILFSPFTTIIDLFFQNQLLYDFFFHQTLTVGKTGKSYAVLMAFFYKIQKHPRASVIPVDEYLTTFFTLLSFLRIREGCF